MMNSNVSSYVERINSIYATLEYVLYFFNFCIGLLATGLNSFVVYALLIRRGFENTHGADMFVIGLTMSELLTSLCLMGSVAGVAIKMNRTYCVVLICFFQTSMLCASFFVTAMTSDRYFKIVFPFWYQHTCSEDVYPLLILIAFTFLAFIVGFLPLLGVGLVGKPVHVEVYDLEERLCSYLEDLHYDYRAAFLTMMALPIIAGLFVYTKILMVARDHVRNIAKTHGTVMRVPRGRYIKMIFIMSGLHCFFYIPPFVVSLLYDHTQVIFDKAINEHEHSVPNHVKVKTIFHLSCIGIMCNTILNPVIYAYTLPPVKEAWQRLVGMEPEVEDLNSSRKSIAAGSTTRSTPSSRTNVPKTRDKGDAESVKGKKRIVDAESMKSGKSQSSRFQKQRSSFSPNENEMSGVESSCSLPKQSAQARKDKLNKTLQMGKWAVNRRRLSATPPSIEGKRGSGNRSMIKRGSSGRSFGKDNVIKPVSSVLGSELAGGRGLKGADLEISPTSTSRDLTSALQTSGSLHNPQDSPLNPKWTLNEDHRGSSPVNISPTSPSNDFRGVSSPTGSNTPVTDDGAGSRVRFTTVEKIEKESGMKMIEPVMFSISESTDNLPVLSPSSHERLVGTVSSTTSGIAKNAEMCAAIQKKEKE